LFLKDLEFCGAYSSVPLSKKKFITLAPHLWRKQKRSIYSGMRPIV